MKKIIFEDNKQSKVIRGTLVKETELTIELLDEYNKPVTIGKKNLIMMRED